MLNQSLKNPLWEGESHCSFEAQRSQDIVLRTMTRKTRINLKENKRFIGDTSCKRYKQENGNKQGNFRTRCLRKVSENKDRRKNNSAGKTAQLNKASSIPVKRGDTFSVSGLGRNREALQCCLLQLYPRNMKRCAEVETDSKASKSGHSHQSDPLHDLLTLLI